ncbi:hypothetical protein SUDANB148_00018 [Streptomyces sp. SudanB148_2056]|uniref:hypothetical protein n=1 Tax=Streptomyces sp. SudanB148_2056 TaxID=3035280 RepID=UPI003F567A90
MEVGSCNDAGIQAVLGALWSAADVHGCFGLRDREPEEQDPVPCTELAAYGFEMYLAEKREALALAP